RGTWDCDSPVARAGLRRAGRVALTMLAYRRRRKRQQKSTDGRPKRKDRPRRPARNLPIAPSSALFPPAPRHSERETRNSELTSSFRVPRSASLNRHIHEFRLAVDAFHQPRENPARANLVKPLHARGQKPTQRFFPTHRRHNLLHQQL